MKILIACENSLIVSTAFANKGHQVTCIDSDLPTFVRGFPPEISSLNSSNFNIFTMRHFTLKIYLIDSRGRNLFVKRRVEFISDVQEFILNAQQNGFSIGAGWVKDSRTQQSVPLSTNRGQREPKYFMQSNIHTCPDCKKVILGISLKCGLNCPNYLPFLASRKTQNPRSISLS
jgi:hypothetical protein